MVANSTYIGPSPLPKYRAGREPTTAGKFEGGQLVQAILTKAVFACENLWGDAVLGSTMTSLLQSMVLVLLHRNGNLCLMPRYSMVALAPFAPKRKQGCCARWRPPGIRLVSIIMAHVTRASRGLPRLDISAPREPAWLGHSRGGLASSASRGPREGLESCADEDGPYWATT